MISWAVLAALGSGAFDGDFPSAVAAGRGGPVPCEASVGDPGEASPALVGGIARPEVGADWTRPLGLEGLDLGGLWARVPLGPSLGIGVRWRALLAEDIYREDQVAVDLGAKVGRVRFGGGGRWGRIELEGRDLGRPLGWAAGLAIEPVARLTAGISWEDASGLGADRIALPWIARGAVAWNAEDSGWTATAGGSLREEGAWRWQFGQEWRWEPLSFRLGVETAPVVLGGGLGFSWRGARVDWGMQGESKFGWQQHLGASWRF